MLQFDGLDVGSSPASPLEDSCCSFFKKNCVWPTHPSFGSVTKATILDPSDPSLCLVGGLRGGRIGSAVVAGFVLRARTRFKLSKEHC